MTRPDWLIDAAEATNTDPDEWRFDDLRDEWQHWGDGGRVLTVYTAPADREDRDEVWHCSVERRPLSLSADVDEHTPARTLAALLAGLRAVEAALRGEVTP